MSEVRPTNASQQKLDQGPEQENHTASAQSAPTSVEPVAPQDSQAAGAAQGEQQSLLHSNVSGSEQKGAAENAEDMAKQQPGGSAGVHSTGSYTGTSNEGGKK